MQIPRITNIYRLFAIIFAAFLTFYGLYSTVFGEGLSAGEYKNVEKEAEQYFYAGMQTEDKSLKEAYLSEALKKYMLLLNINPKDAILPTQIGIIHDNLGHQDTAKGYFFRALSTSPTNPYINFYFAEYYFAKKDYPRALECYIMAYSNGYSGLYEVNLKLGTIYERLGDINKAKKYYSTASSLKPNFSELKNKLKSLDSIYYSKSDYK